MNISRKKIGDALFQLPFSGLGISLKECEQAAATMTVRFSEKSDFSSSLVEELDNTSFPVISGYDLLLTLGREIRGR